MLGLVAAQAPSNSYGAPGARSNGNGLSDAYGAPGEEDPIEALASSIPGGGVPGEDFPVLSEVPDTGFLCEDQEFPGYYADTNDEAGCQVFHICQDLGGQIRQDSFLCPNGTIFNQQYLVCDWWFNFDCATAEEFFSVNEAIGQEAGADGPYGASGQPENGNGNGYGNGNGNGRRANGNGKRKNGNGNGNGAPQNGYGAPSAPSASYGTPS